MTEELYPGDPKFILGELGVQFFIPEQIQDLPKVSFMFLLAFGVDQNVIDEDNYKLVQIRFTHLVHKVNEHSWCISQTKRHDLEFIVTISSPKCSLRNVLFSNSQLKDPSFFLTNRTGAPQGEELGLMKPLSVSSCSGSASSFISDGANLYGARATGAAPEKIKDGLGYNAVPPPAADLYLSPKKDLSWTGLPEFADNIDTDYSRPSPTVESTLEEGKNKNSSTSEGVASPITPKSFVKFVKPKDCQSESKPNKKETPKKPPVKYAEMYKRPSKNLTVRGNQRNWNNLKTQQLGPDFAMKKKACYNCGNFSHLANDCRKRVQRETTRSQNHAYVSPSHRSTGHRSYGAPMRPSHRLAGHKPHGPPMRPMRSNMNGARPKRASAVRPQYRAPWVPTVNRNFPPVNRKLPTGNSNVSTVCCCCSRHVNTARPKAVINRRNRVKDVQASACWVWKPVKPNSASII
nr:ubiquitin hydrolase [Tanacetum cinerariifolium]